MISYKLMRSNRKTVGLYIREGAVEVRAPLKMPKGDIDRFVASKANWIADKLAKSNAHMASRERFTLKYGDYVLYRGKQYPIAERLGDRIGFDEVCFYMPPKLTPEQLKYSCVHIYRLLAKRDLTKKTLEFAKRMSVMPSAIKINSAKTRWGSCSALKSVNFSWRLIMADDDVIDYVVVHELAHIIELNHSARFWSIIESVFPDYTSRKARLKVLQDKLSHENWD